MSFIRKNENFIRDGLINTYSNKEYEETNSTFYLTHDQIDGIMEYLDNIGDNDINIEAFIDNQIVNGYGFDKYGRPIEELEEDEEDVESLMQ